MGSIWEVVLASSVVSTVLSTLIAGMSKIYAENRQSTVVAHMIARGLEDYVRKCATHVVETNAAMDRASELISYDPLRGLGGVPSIELQLSGLDRLKSDWRDRILAFPNKVTSAQHQVAREWYYLNEPFECAVVQLNAEVELGQAAFDLALKLREAHRLSTLHSRSECSKALSIFAAEVEDQKLRDERGAANNASIHAYMSAATQTQK